MGGLGSGRPGRRATVEGTAALVLDAAAVVRAFREALRRGAPGGAVPEGTVPLQAKAQAGAR